MVELLNILKVLGLLVRLFLRFYFFIGSLLLVVLAFGVFWLMQSNQRFHATDWVIFGIIFGLYFLSLLEILADMLD